MRGLWFPKRFILRVKAFLSRTGFVVSLVMAAGRPLIGQSVASPPAEDTVSHRAAIALRGLTAVLGWIPGAFVGGFVGARVPHSPCGCDDPGLSEVLGGIVIGGALGAGFGAAVPKLNSRCSFGRRFGLGLLGSVVGTGIGMISWTQGVQVLTVPLFSTVGAAIAEWPC